MNGLLRGPPLFWPKNKETGTGIALVRGRLGAALCLAIATLARRVERALVHAKTSPLGQAR